ncbi:hypothetical protein [Streptomyces durhamensis]|uniref:hypothetical protein n=1 Tax=Streptomyces durhamensis TaxID=68194 RepID=UPI000A7D9D2F|nr:hypothetical protein [Streptomyces durhamensis]
MRTIKPHSQRGNPYGRQADRRAGAARDVFVQGWDLALIAGAGTGKTSTLILVGASVLKKRGIYVSFNREITENA